MVQYTQSREKVEEVKNGREETNTYYDEFLGIGERKGIENFRFVQVSFFFPIKFYETFVSIHHCS